MLKQGTSEYIYERILGQAIEDYAYTGKSKEYIKAQREAQFFLFFDRVDFPFMCSCAGMAMQDVRDAAKRWAGE